MPSGFTDVSPVFTWGLLPRATHLIEPASGNVQHQGSYMLIQCIKDSQHLMPTGRLKMLLPCFYLARLLQGGRGRPACFYYTLSCDTDNPRKSAVALIRQRVPILRWQLNFPVCFMSQRDLSMQPWHLHPRRSQSPPF